MQIIIDKLNSLGDGRDLIFVSFATVAAERHQISLYLTLADILHVLLGEQLSVASGSELSISAVSS